MKRFVHGPLLSYSPYMALALFLMLLLTSLNYFYLSAQNYQLLSSNTNQQKDIDHLQVPLSSNQIFIQQVSTREGCKTVVRGWTDGCLKSIYSVFCPEMQTLGHIK